MTGCAYVWLGFAVALLVLEGLTANLVSMWFAGGAVASFFAALMKWSVPAQILLFAAVSAVLLACLRPLARKKAIRTPAATNADRILGRTAVVTEPIDNLRSTGAVRIDGLEWTARSAGGEAVAAGESVKIVEISGVKAVVEPIIITK